MLTFFISGHRDMTISSFEARDVMVRAIVKGGKCQNQGSKAKTRKVSTLYFLKLEKFKKKQCTCFFICGPEAEIWPLSHFLCISL